MVMQPVPVDRTFTFGQVDHCGSLVGHMCREASTYHHQTSGKLIGSGAEPSTLTSYAAIAVLLTGS